MTGGKEGIRIDKPTHHRVVVARHEVIEPRLRIIVIPTITNGVEVGKGEVRAGDRYGCTPGIVGIFGDEVAACIVDARDVALQIEAVIVGRGAVEDKTNPQTAIVKQIVQRGDGTTRSSRLGVDDAVYYSIFVGSVSYRFANAVAVFVWEQNSETESIIITIVATITILIPTNAQNRTKFPIRCYTKTF